MTPRLAEQIVAAALRWNAAREHRLAVGAFKRAADEACKTTAYRFFSEETAHQLAAAKALSVARRRELAAARALAKLCPYSRVDLPMTDVVVQLPEFAT